MAFDPRRNRLLFLSHARALFEVRADAGGDLDRPSLSGRDVTRFGLRDPQGIAVDPARGTVFVLDAAQPRILRIEPGSDGGLDAATTFEIDLRPAGLRTVRGLAFDPATGNLTLSSGRTLVELAPNGAVVATRDLTAFALSKPEGLVFAPSGDRTDASSQLSLYVADSGTAPTGSPVAASGAGRPAPSEGQIIELSLAPEIAAAAATFTSQLVRTLDMGALSPPSPDPSGITYVPSTDRLLVSDGEVEETVV
jgi:DNA-binding beta-propeller fold protein YncE